MRSRPLSAALVACLFGLSAARGAEFRVESREGLPEQTPAAIAASLDSRGTAVVGEAGPVIEVWLVKSAAPIENFQPTLTVKYPFATGQLIGLLHVPAAGRFTDFREQPIAAGVYSLRYGQQPEDGNHVGTSDTRDFLLALPVADERTADRIADVNELQQASADAAGTTHPAILSLLDPHGAADDAAEIEHDPANNFWILNVKTPGETPVLLRIVFEGVGAV